MPAPDRSVRHLRLRAANEAQVRGTALRLADALRCASLPDTGGRLLLVRRLDLGRIGAEASSQSLALAIEQGVSATALEWVHGTTPAAATASAVWFDDALDACIALSLRLATNQPMNAWYWPLAVPGFRDQEGAAAGLRRIALYLAENAAAPRALPLWAGRLVEAGHATHLAAAIEPQTANILLRAVGLTVPAATEPRPPSASPLTPVAAEKRLAVGTKAPPPHTPPWLQALLQAAGWRGPTPGPPPVVPAHLHAPLASPADSPLVSVRTPAEPLPPISPTAVRGGTPPRRQARGRPQASPPRQPVGPRLDPLGTALPARPHRERAEQPPPAETGGPWPAALPSRCGGLLFLLPALVRLGYGQWWDENPPWRDGQIAQRLLIRALQRLRAAADDPAWTLAEDLLSGAAEPVPEAQPFPVPDIWRDPALGIDLIPSDLNPDEAADLWLRAVRRWLRRVARVGVASLVRRRAGLIWTPTHVDVVFALGDSDLRVRRAGLDLDPGWLPWLGRVVGFHYLAGMNTR